MIEEIEEAIASRLRVCDRESARAQTEGKEAIKYIEHHKEKVVEYERQLHKSNVKLNKYNDRREVLNNLDDVVKRIKESKK